MALGTYAQMSGTYTIDPSGSGSTNFTTWNAAVSALESQGVNGAVTINVAEGTYTEQVQLDAIPGSSAANLVTFQPDPSNTSEAVLQYGGYYQHVLRIDGTSNVRFTGLKFVGTSFYTRTIYIYSSNTNVEIDNNEIVGYFGTSSNNNATVYYYGSQPNVDVHDNDISGAMVVFYYASDANFHDNNIHDTYYYGVYMYQGSNNTVEDNYISAGDGSSSYYGYGVYIYYGNGHSIVGNDIDGHGYGYNYGLQVRYHYGTSGSPTLIANNFIHNSNSCLYYSYGMYSYYSGNLDFKHNTVSSYNAGYGGYNIQMYSYSYSYGGNTVTNNIFSNPNDGQGYGYGAYIYAYNFSSTFFDTIDFNVWDYHGGSLNNYGYGTGQMTTVGAWQTATGSASNDVVTEVPFMSSTDLHISPSLSALTIDNICDPTGMAYDIDGDMRGSNPDPGADEFVVPTNNSGLGGLLNPNAPLCSDDTSIIANLKNTGLVALTSSKIYYSINGVLQDSVSWTGSLAVGSDTDVVVEASITFTDGDTLYVWSAWPNGVPDSSTTGDDVTVYLNEGLTGTYGIPSDFPTLTAAAAAANQKGVCDHVVMSIAPGSYNEQITLGEIDGASENATLTWTSSTGDMDDVDIYFASSSADGVVNMAGSDYVTFTDLTIRQTSGSYNGRVFNISGGAEMVTIENSHLVGSPYTTTSNAIANIYAPGANHGLTISNNIIEKGSYSIYLNGGGTSSRVEDVTVSNNDILDHFYFGAYLYYVDGIDFNDNVVTSDTTMYNYGPRGVYCYYVDDYHIDRNYIGTIDSLNGQYGSYGGYAYALYMGNCIGIQNDRSTITNNCVNAGATGSTGYGYYPFYMYNSGFVNVHNNSFTRLGGSQYTYYAGYFSGGGQTSIMNNAFTNYSTGYAMYVYGAWTVTESNNNAFYNTSGSMIYYGNSAYNSLEDYQNASGYDMASWHVDPAYVDTMMCVTCNDTLDNNGHAMSYTTYDVDSNMRSGNTPDIGSHEWISPASFTLGGDSTYCADSVLLEAGPAQTISWSVNSNTSNNANYMLEGGCEPITYAVLVSIGTEYCGSGSDNANITLIPSATLDSNIHICADEDATLDPCGGATATYSWSTTETTQTITVSEPGMYSVTKMEEGCESSAMVEVTQSAAVEILDVEVCSSDLPLSLDATIADGVSYTWDGGTSVNTAVNTFNDEGTYNVTATDAFGCESTDDFMVTVLEEPVAGIDESHSGLTYFFSADTGASNYVTSNTTFNWDFGVGATPATSTNMSEVVSYPWTNPSNLASYSVTLEIDNGCGIDLETIQITPDPVGISELTDGTFAIYPNPASDVVTIATKNVDAGMIQIMDMSGRIIVELPTESGSNSHSVDVSSIAAGSYMVKVSNNAASTVQSLIIQ